MKLGYRIDSIGEIADAKVYISRKTVSHSQIQTTTAVRRNHPQYLIPGI